MFFPEEKQPENCEITESFKEKEHLDLGTFETFVDKKTSYRETAWSPRKNEKECNTPEVTLPHLVENVEYEIPATIDYLQDEQRYEELDDSLYLGEEEYLESVVYSKDAETTEEEEDYYDPEHHVYYGEEDSEYSETTEFSDEEQNYGDSEPGMSLEEEEEEKSMEEKKNLFKDVLSRLNMDRSRKLLPDFVKQFSLDRGCNWTPQTPGDLAWNFLMKVQALDVTARDSVLRHKVLCEDSKGELPTGIENLEMRDIQTINPLDVLCASMLCSDSSLQRRVLSSMYQCQFALPLLLPDAENNKSILMLGAMKDIVKKQSTQSSGGPTRETETFLTLIKVPVISFVRLGNCSFSKSRILNTLLSPTHQKSHKIFLHQDLPVLVLPRQISDGLVEITWCFPDSDSLKENLSFSQKPVAVANLRGDLESFWTQFGFLMEVSSAVFFFTNCLGEKEWNLLMFLGEAAIERCYFVLSPQARENEEAQIFQRILKLKPSQLLFWEEEEAGDKGKNIKGLQAALQEVMSSSLRRVSVEDMASLARELGIQVDQDFENVQGIQVSPGENLAGTVEDEGQQRHSPPQSSPGNPAEKPMKEPVAGCEVSQTLQNIHLSPVFTRHLQNSCLLPVRIGCNFNHVSLKAPWVRGSHFWSEQKTKWFHPSPFQNARVHSRGKGFGIQYFQPQRFYSGERFMNFSRPPQGRHVHGTFVRPPRPLCHRVQAWPEGSRERSARVVSQVGHLHSLSSQPVGPFGKPQSGQAHAWRTQTPEATRKVMRTTSHTVNPHPQAFQPAGVIQKPTRPAFQQGFKQKMERGPSNPVFRMGSHPMSNSKVLPTSQFKSNQPQPSQVQHSQPKPFQPMPSQLKRTQTKATQPQPSQAKCSPSKPTQPKPCQPQSSQSKPSQPRSTQPRSTQPKSSQTRPSQAKAGPKRVGKH
ncbi:caspase recruitment domain-containing protein 6 isoform X2 [Pteropus medius]|nr:caspase recruitment domain-containing protein 6 isoform X2 [Pteropus giganteus]XP_039698527.1 caspase recruitment domain-containing protein 6 isoform X2 [Pteropus giganteus]XP_039698528.1 caspase recruitment domain-containing protein 6 isoform X2 [Pteropus giganteus]XP_039698529.1 caspase recruitment domain-containing protein 6 isoform X2 [Pteropus giganteus]